MLSLDAVQAIAARYRLGVQARLEGPVARGQLGQVWRLTTADGRFAVKEWFAAPDPTAVEADTDFAERARAAGVLVPAAVRDAEGAVLATVTGTVVRVSRWVDLEPPTRRLDPMSVGHVLARLHGLDLPADRPIEAWFSRGIGAPAWRDLHCGLLEARAPFAARLGAVLDDLVAAESIIAESVIAEPVVLRLCHRDLWADNVLGTPDGAVCVIDFENHGPADPAHELAMVLYEFGDDEPDRVRAVLSGYVEAGGPARLTGRGDFTMVVAQLVHIAQLAGRRWIETPPGTERDRLGAWCSEVLDDPPTLPRIDRVLAAIGPSRSTVGGHLPGSVQS